MIVALILIRSQKKNNLSSVGVILIKGHFPKCVSIEGSFSYRFDDMLFTLSFVRYICSKRFYFLKNRMWPYCNDFVGVKRSARQGLSTH